MNRVEFLQRLHIVLERIETERQRRQAGQDGPGTVAELEYIRQELAGVGQMVASGALPPRDQRWIASSRIVTDTWSPDDVLGENIAYLARIYREEALT
jgi:hypothetical protein